MSLRIFVDTSAWKAYLDKKDVFHEAVSEQFLRCRCDHTVLVTTDYILSETATLLRMRRGLGHRLAVQFGKMVLNSQVVHLKHVSSADFHRAWEIFERYADKDFSFVDCASFAVMENEKLNSALALDEHFVQYGFQKLPD